MLNFKVVRILPVNPKPACIQTQYHARLKLSNHSLVCHSVTYCAIGTGISSSHCEQCHAMPGNSTRRIGKTLEWYCPSSEVEKNVEVD